MPAEFDLPQPRASEGWKCKILEKEVREPPYATVSFKTRRWRYSLRDDVLLDDEPPPRELPQDLLTWLRRNHRALVDAWDAKYPKNPVYPRPPG